MSKATTSRPRTRRRFPRLGALLTVLATLSLVLVTAPAQADPASPPPGAAKATGWYLALGDSVAAGYQPGFGDDKQGGYVGPVLAAVKNDAATAKTHLENLACSGETSTTLVDGGRCSYEEGSQLAQALLFLHAHTATTRLVTLTIGANDVTPCLQAGDQAAIAACLNQKLTTFAANLSQIVGQVHAAAPGARIVVTNYYNPFLASWFSNPALANLTTALQMQLNNTIANVTSAATAGTGHIADVATAFHSYDVTPVEFGGLPAVPTNVVYVCTYTWMCAKTDIHPNDGGYALIAGAVTSVLH